LHGGVYIGVGSNLSDPAQQVRTALEDLSGIAESRLLACSSLYRTSPVGPQDQPDYVNAVARLETRLSARDLLAALQGIERRHGRVRDGTRWGPRTLDLDILLFGGAVVDEPGLRLPHPEIGRRAFVLIPLADLAPAELEIPGQGRLADLLARCAGDGVLRLAERPPPACGHGGQLAESPDLQQE
jgi:2-amino-4-hydroxy-6-hydroxymethyldihydropteridine diphosphokinase